MRNILILGLVLVVSFAGYYAVMFLNDTNQSKQMNNPPADSAEVSSFAADNGQFTIQYSEDKTKAEVVYNDRTYDLAQIPSSSETKYANADQSVVFSQQNGVTRLKVQDSEIVVDSTLVDANQKDVRLFEVGPQKVDCVGVAPMKCLVVNGENFYDSIAGFDFEPGYNYTLAVERTVRESVPADASKYQYTLLEVISKVSSTDPEAALVDTTWKWTQTIDGSGEVVIPAAGNADAFSLTLQADGRFSVTTDCNTGTGSYTKTTDTLRLGAIAATQMACPGETQEAEFLAALSAVTEYEVTKDGDLLLQSGNDELQFVPKG